MRYLEIDTGPPSVNWKLPWWVKILQFIIPTANPDLEPLFDQTQIWWLEIDDLGEPKREIGFDSSGKAIVLGPVNGNFGFLIDAADYWGDATEDSVKAAKNFDVEWNALWPSFEMIHKRNMD